MKLIEELSTRNKWWVNVRKYMATGTWYLSSLSPKKIKKYIVLMFSEYLLRECYFFTWYLNHQATSGYIKILTLSWNSNAVVKIILEEADI